ncbi:MAG: hypothetical protein QM504_06920 [Pseudomonadota bacterium]
MNGNSSWAIAGGFNGMFRKDKGKSLNNHSVAFHGNANNDFRSGFLFDRAGIEIISKRSNDYDIVNKLLGANTINPWQIAGSLVYWNHTTSGSIQQSPHTTMHNGFDDWNNKMEEAPGKGRGAIQNAFNYVDEKARSSIKAIDNYLK